MTRKIVLATTALVSMFAVSALADAPTVTVSGKVDFMAVSTSQKSEAKDRQIKADGTVNFHIRNNKNMSFQNESKVVVAASGKTDSGMGYGAVAKLLPSESQSSGYSNGKMDRTYVWMESNMGRVELGGNFGASRAMKVDASTIARATGGASDGDAPGYFYTSNYPLTAANMGLSLLKHSDDGEEMRKISWYSPVFNGVQLGVSYAPDGANRNELSNQVVNETLNTLKDIFQVGLSYANNFDKFNFKFAAVADFGTVNTLENGIAGFQKSVKDTNKNKLQSYEVGFAVGSGNLSMAASYGSHGKSLEHKDDSNLKSDYYTVGAAYEQGPMAASLTYFSAKSGETGEKHKFSAISLGADYQLAAGLMPYAEVTYLDYKPYKDLGNDIKNKGTVFMLGTVVKF